VVADDYFCSLSSIPDWRVFVVAFLKIVVGENAFLANTRKVMTSEGGCAEMPCAWQRVMKEMIDFY
jgi:hypothetical protein